MSKTDIIRKIEELNTWESLMEEAKAEAEAIKDSIKAEMLANDTEELEAGQYIVRWTPVTANRFDSASFKKALPEVYKAYLKQSTSRRFSISA
jgi:predicted phage-related endonuclease